MSRRLRLTIVQYAGDFREASERLKSEGPETYRGQRYTVEYVESLAGRLNSVTTITCYTDTPYDTLLSSGARAIGAGCQHRLDSKRIVELIEETSPDILVLRTPLRPAMRWAMRRKCPTLMLLADSFNSTSLKSRAGQFLMAMMLKNRVFEIVANHGTKATEQLLSLGISPDKLIAWDYPAFDSPHARAAKQLSSSARKVLYVGLLTADKGLDDLVTAASILRDRGNPIRLELIGRGEEDRLKQLVSDLNLDEWVTFAGIVPNGEILSRMRAADIVTVPSRHEYSEGMPLTIYEGYCSRTPLVTSDHPMFVDNVVNGESGLIVPERQPDALAAAIDRILSDDGLYAHLSQGGLRAWEKLQIPAKWDQIIDQWIDDTPASRLWLKNHSLASTRKSA